MSPHEDRRPSAVTATINLAGHLTPTIATFQAGAGAHITLTVHTVVLVFMDRQAAGHYALGWNEWAARQVARRLPEVHRLPSEPTIGLTVRTSHDDENRVLPGAGKLALRTGSLTWVTHDQVAYEAMSRAHDQVAELATLILPKRY